MHTAMFNILCVCLHTGVALVWIFTWSRTIDLLFLRQWAPKSPDGRFAAYSVMYAYKWCLMMSSRARKQNITVFKAKHAGDVRRWKRLNTFLFPLFFFLFIYTLSVRTRWWRCSLYVYSNLMLWFIKLPPLYGWYLDVHFPNQQVLILLNKA